MGNVQTIYNIHSVNIYIYIYIMTCISKVRTVVVYFVDFTTLFFLWSSPTWAKGAKNRFMGFKDPKLGKLLYASLGILAVSSHSFDLERWVFPQHLLSRILSRWQLKWFLGLKWISQNPSPDSIWFHALGEFRSGVVPLMMKALTFPMMHQVLPNRAQGERRWKAWSSLLTWSKVSGMGVFNWRVEPPTPSFPQKYAGGGERRVGNMEQLGGETWSVQTYLNLFQTLQILR